MLEDIRDFVQSVVSARKESAPVEIPDFYAKVSSPFARLKKNLTLCISVAFGEYSTVHVHTFTIDRA